MKWPTAKLGDVAEIERDGVQPENITAGTLYLGLEHIQIGGEIIAPKPVNEGELASNKFRFDQRHVLYGKLRPNLAKIARPDFDGICSTDIVPIAPGPKLDRGFLLHFLRQPEMVAYASSRTAGINLPRLSPSVLEGFELPLPPLPEQQRIADILDRAEGLRAKRRAALALLDTLPQAIFLEMFGDPLRNYRGWRLSKLGEVASIERGKFTPRPRNDPSYYGGSYPFIQTGDISTCSGRLETWTQTLNEKGIGVSRKFPPGTIVVAIVGATIGATAILDVEVYCPDSVVGIQPHPDIASAEYMERVLRFWRPEFVERAPETARANINLETFRPLLVPLPPLPLQQQFARRVAAVEQLKASQRSSLAQLDELFASLQHRAFRGEL